MKRIFPITMIVIGVLLSVGAFGWLYGGSATSNSTAIDMPKQLAGLSRAEYRTGAQAMAEFESLHGKQFPLISGAIGIYGDQQITIWAAEASSDSVAVQMVESMRDKIAEGNSPFTPLTQIADKNRIVYELEGMGQTHYYFQSKNLVIWLAADPSLADEALQQTLEAYP